MEGYETYPIDPHLQYATHVRPELARLLHSIRMDVSFERAERDYLYQRRNGHLVSILDLVGGYGTLLLGHNHPELIRVVKNFLEESRPVHAQGSIRTQAGILAEKLLDLICRGKPDYKVIFGNSGAEAVEIALKHALLERTSPQGKPVLIAVENGFHGKTLGALQVTYNPKYRLPFSHSGWEVIFVRRNDDAHLQEAFRNADVTACILEPIQGEGGVNLLSPAFMQRAQDLCRGHDVPLIVDECQTGLGRTGRILESNASGVTPDYIILSKALSGGVSKISAVLIRSERYHPEIGLLHTSTYSEDDLSCAVALKVLELIQKNDGEVLRLCASKGSILESQLRTVQEKHPDVIRDIRGRGLMLGIEFSSELPTSSRMLHVLGAEGMLGYVIAAYLFWEHRIRIAPTLSQPMTLRVEPSAFIHEQELSRFVEAVDNVCSLLERGDTATLTSFLGVEEKVGSFPKQPADGTKPEGDKKVAWLFHLKTIEDVRHFDSSLASLDSGSCERLLRRFEYHPICAVLDPIKIRSQTGASVHFYPIFLPVTSARMKEAIDQNNLPPVKALIYHGIAKAKELGCRVVSLGQYTSIVTLNGYQARTQGIGVTTGNSLTVALSVKALLRMARERDIEIKRSTLAVVGASGNIGSICASLLAKEVDRLILVGSNKSNAGQRLARLAEEIRSQTSMNGRLETTADLSRVREANLIISSVNTPYPVLDSDHLQPRAIVCDISVPASVDARVIELRPDVAVFQGGVVRLPQEELIDIPGFPLPRGHAFACMGEGLLLALEGIHDHFFTGPVSTEKVERIQAIAEKHGFDLKEYKT